jgi:hypothetical protein
MPVLKPLPPLEALSAHLSLDEEGRLVWNRTNAPAGFRRKDGYWQIRVCGSKRLLHRIVYALANGADPYPLFVDHIDGNPSNNHLSNLRTATHTENLRNARRLRRNNSSGNHGVMHATIGGIDYWKAVIGVGGRTLYLGAYKSKEAAIAAREVAELFVFGKYSSLAALPSERLLATATRTTTSSVAV